MLVFSLLIGKLSSFFIRKFTKRNGSTWPGHLVIESNSNFINQILSKNPNLQIVLIAGTNGKTTTAKAIHHILSEKGVSTCRNEAGANLVNGFASLLTNEANLKGKIKKEAVVFEVDENSLPLLLKKISSSRSKLSIVLLNLFRDQLDRYGEVNATSEKWKEAIKTVGMNTQIIANADDPQIVAISKDLKDAFYYTISDELKKEREFSHAVDSTTCPNCRSDLSYSKIAYSHLGNFHCKSCGFKNPKAQIFSIKSSLEGTFNLYNLSAAVLLCSKTFDISANEACKSLFDLKPAFGRQEVIKFKDKKVKILLSKNPAGFNESLKVVLEKKYSNLLIVLNDRIPDGRDISWIWDVDFEVLKKNRATINVSGDRTYDIANRLKYADIEYNPVDSLEKALSQSLEQVKDDETLVILPTYSAMLEVRKLLTGKSIL